MKRWKKIDPVTASRLRNSEPSMQRIEDILSRAIEYAIPPPSMTVTEWSEEYRVMSAKDSSEPGPYRSSRTPYAVEPMDALSQESMVEEVVLMFGAQTSKTTIGSNWLGYLMDTNPGPIMIVQPTIDMAKRYSRQRLTPMITDSPQLVKKVRENRSRDDANTTLLKEFAGGFLAVAGANSAAGLRSMPVRDLFMDEVDAYPLDVDGEGDPLKLAEARQTTFARKKRLITSTPTLKGYSRIEQRFLASDQNYFHVPCPLCGEFQPLEWGASKPHGLKFRKDDDGALIPESVRYTCAHCGGLFEEHHKPEMLAAGKWVPHHSKAKNKKVKGYHLSSLYSPLGWLSWTAIAQEWIDSMNAMKHGDTSLLRVFINTRLAETFEDQGERADEHTLWKRADDFPLGRVKWHHFVVTMGCDVQRDRVECYVWAWGRGMERQLVARHVCFGDPNIPENEPDSPWTKLTEIRREPIFHASGLVVPVVAVFIDSGGSSTQAVYQYCRQWQHAHVWAIKGQSQAGKPILGRPSTVDINWRGAKVLGGLKLWPLGVDTAKFEIYNSLRLDKVGAGYINLTRELPMEVFEQLTSEKLITSYVNGQPRQKWVLPSGKRNEALDCAVYALAGAHYAGLTRWKEKEWMKAELRVEPSDMIKAGVNPPKRIRAEPKPVEEPREPKPQAKKVTRDW